MNNQLSGAWQLITDSVRMYKSRFNDLLAPIAIYILVTIALSLLQIPTNKPLVVLNIILTIIFSIWIRVVFIRLSADVIDGKKVSASTLYRDSYARSPKFLWLSIIAGLLVLLGLIVFVIPGIILMVILFFTPFIVALDNPALKTKEILVMAKNLVEKRWWAVCWRLVAPAIFFALVLGLFACIVLIILKQGLSTDLTDIISNPYFGILIVIVSGLMEPLYTLTQVKLFKELKQS